MRAQAWVVVGLAVVAGGCTSVRDLGHDKYLVPRLVEVRSPFGTNAGWLSADLCEGPAKAEGLQPLYVAPEDYRNCVEVYPPQMVSSQGQGGQIVSGLLQGAGLVGLGALMPANTTTVNAQGGSAVATGGAGGTSITTTVINGVGKGK